MHYQQSTEIAHSIKQFSNQLINKWLRTNKILALQSKLVGVNDTARIKFIKYHLEKAKLLTAVALVSIKL